MFDGKIMTEIRGKNRAFLLLPFLYWDPGIVSEHSPILVKIISDTTMRLEVGCSSSNINKPNLVIGNPRVCLFFYEIEYGFIKSLENFSLESCYDKICEDNKPVAHVFSMK